jgi:hypothetical protein
MKYLLPLSLCVLNSALALPSYEPFADSTAAGGTSYSMGGNLVGQNNPTLFSAWYTRGTNAGTVQPVISAGNLSYPDLPVSTGNSVSFVPANAASACIDLNLTATHTLPVYYSFILKITDLSGVTTTPTNNPICGYLDDPTPQGGQIARIGSRLVTKKVGSGYVLGISRSASITDFVYEPDVAAHNLNDVLFVVGVYQRIAGVQTNVSLWINPPASSFGSNQPPPATLVALTGNTGINNNSARAFGIFCQFAGAPGGTIDDVRVATNWAFATGGDPAILQGPTNRIVPPGNTANFSVAARGTPTLSYQWYKNGTTPLSDGGNISGAQTATLTVSSVGAGDAGNYSVFVTNGVGDFAQSGSATLSLLTDPIITAQPQGMTTNFGGTATFQVTAGGTAPFGYRWHKDGVDLNDGGNITGSQSNILTITGLAFGDGGNYSVTVTNTFGSVDSATAALTVLDPYVSTQPVSVTTNAGATAIFNVGATGTGSFNYQWLKNGNFLFDGGNVSGAASDTLTVANLSAADQAGYSAIVIGLSSVTSSVASLTVLSPVSIPVQPNPRTVIASAKAVFAVEAAGSGTLSYQWQREGVDIPSATAAAYVIANAQASDQGNYRVIVTNSFSAATSSVAVLSVSNSLTLDETNLIVIRVGDGAQGLTLNGNSMALDQFDVNGGYVNSVSIPDSGPSALVALGPENLNGVNSGSTTGNGLSRSLDGRFMVIAGYNTNLNYGANLNASFATNVPRGVGLIESHAQYTLAVSDTNSVYDATIYRCAISDGTNNYWGAAGAGGTFYFGFDAAAGVIQTTFANMRSMSLFNGDIYCAGAVAGSTGVLKISGMPKTATTPALLFSGSSGSYDMTVSPDGNLIYLADQRSVLNGGGIQRYEFDGSNWNLAYTITSGFGNLGPRMLTADFSGPTPVIYATCNDQTFENNRLVKIVDTGAGSAAATLAYAGANQTFRGIHFGPVENTVVARPTLSFVRQGNNLILSWAGAFRLQSSANVMGTYVDVGGATSPYTNSVTAATQQYFRLRN